MKQLSISLLLPIFLATSASAKPLIITADTWCPYNCDATSRERGFMIDVAAEVLAKHGYEVQYVNNPWTRSLEKVLAGTADAVVGAGADEAKELVTALEPLGINKTCFYTLAGSDWRYAGLASLTKIKLGVIAGYLYGGETDSYIAQHRIDFPNVQLVAGDKPLLQNVKKLQAGRIDVLVENAMVMDFSLRKFSLLGLRNAGCDRDTPLYIAFSPKRSEAKQWAEFMNSGIPELRRSGRLKKILERYGVRDWQ